MRNPTEKTVQIHYECVCGYNDVYQDSVLIKYKDLSKAGIKRKKDKRTGKYFLMLLIKNDQCNGHDFE